eukprot:CAMPEP_0178962456 /NCGR_PEP_ID=MMETSP0789-20121207/14377_1 /TAXON_ID=3005 /ORGANISM="Rhizosolenia setigera, Strain CCMP 1694" /LENGTH=261 /DNA_ID=CAMNT_0020646613 /DNA_START=446 /DNA_END=1231 /DNA_ORIENTATION=+
MCPYGIILLASEKYPDNLLKYGANIVANIVEQDEVTKDILAHNGRSCHGFALACGVNAIQEGKEAFLRGISGSYSCQTWKAGSDASPEEYKAIMVEEAFHMIHAGWDEAHPDIFGRDSFTSSVICRETASHQCTEPGWWHPENQCPDGAPFEPGNPADSPLEPGYGDCTDPSCDCDEFFRQAATLYMDWTDLPFWYSDYMPSTKEGLMDMVSDEFKDMLADPQYYLPQEPVIGEYTVTEPSASSGECVRNIFKNVAKNLHF